MNFPMSTNSSFSCNDPKKSFKLIHTRKTAVSSWDVNRNRNIIQGHPGNIEELYFLEEEPNMYLRVLKLCFASVPAAKGLLLAHSKVHVHPIEISSGCEGYNLMIKEVK